MYKQDEKIKEFFFTKLSNFALIFKCKKLNIPFDGRINPSDLRYYQNQREEKEFKVNHSKLQEYFPLDVVINGTFKIYQVFRRL